ncbi:hypothetical protein FRB93_008317 [Tulasnella sp. JGI-2019a]|nr:hypothetical protein FRB93_008317 [Tulasnella sp. JGI-2019a]
MVANQTVNNNPNDVLAAKRDVEKRMPMLLTSPSQTLIRRTSIDPYHQPSDVVDSRCRDVSEAGTRYRRNSLLPIHNTIPVEIFSMILDLVVQEEHPAFRFTETLRCLASVSKYWKQVVLSSPTLWFSLHESMDPIAIRRSIRNSGDVPLDIQFYPAPREPSNRVEEFSEAVAPLSIRWRTLQGDDIPCEVLQKLESPTPALRKLELWGPRSHVELGEGASLRSVGLWCITLPWDSNRFHGLVELSLGGMFGEHAPTLLQIVRILQLSPGLRSLSLSRLELLAEEQPSTTTKIDLPELTSLHLEELPQPAYDYLLAHFQFPFPNCRTVHLEPSSPSTPIPTSTPTSPISKPFDFLAKEFVQQISIVAEKNKITVANVHIGDTEIELEVLDPHFEQETPILLLKLDINSSGNDEEGEQKDESGTNDSYSGVLTRMADLISKAMPNTPLHLQLHDDDMHTRIPFDLLSRFASTGKITVKYDIDSVGVQPLLQFLATRNTNNDSSPEKWPFSRLSRLDVGQAYKQTVGELRDWVKERWVLWESEGEDEGEKPMASVRVKTPMLGAGRYETWRPVVQSFHHELGELEGSDVFDDRLGRARARRGLGREL